MPRGYPDYEGGKAGLYGIAEWGAKEGNSVDLYVAGTNKASGTNVYNDYGVAAGKTLYIFHTSFYSYAYSEADRDNNQMCVLDFLILPDLTSPLTVGGNGGGSVTLDKPIVVTTGKTLRYRVTNTANHNCNMGVGFSGILI